MRSTIRNPALPRVIGVAYFANTDVLEDHIGLLECRSYRIKKGQERIASRASRWDFSFDGSMGTDYAASGHSLNMASA